MIISKIEEKYRVEHTRTDGAIVTAWINGGELYEACQALTAYAEEIKTPEETMNEKIQASSQKLVDQLMEGGKAMEAIILSYPEWQEGHAVQAGDIYRQGSILYVARQDHITGKENAPGHPDFWSQGGEKKGEEEEGGG